TPGSRSASEPNSYRSRALEDPGAPGTGERRENGLGGGIPDAICLYGLPLSRIARCVPRPLGDTALATNGRKSQSWLSVLQRETTSAESRTFHHHKVERRFGCA